MDVLNLITGLQAISLVFLACGAGAIYVLWKGCKVLRVLVRRSVRDDSPILLKSPRVPAVSVIAVAHDSTPQTLGYVRRILDLHFGHHELILVLEDNDLADLDIWTKEFSLVLSHRSTGGELQTSPVQAAYESTLPLSMLVLMKNANTENDSWNMGVNAASSPVVAFFDPESEFSSDSLLRMIRPMLDNPELVFAVCGTAPAPSASGISGSFADIEATRMWLGRCAACGGNQNMLVPVPGSAMLIRRDAIIAAGGFFGGPMELFVNLQARARRSGKPYRAEFVPEPVSYLPAAKNFRDLRQRVLRDQFALVQAMRRRKFITGGRFALGWALPALTFHRFWRPILETFVYLIAITGVIVGRMSWEVGLLVLLATAGTGMLVSMTSVVLRELADFHGSDPARLTRLFWATIPENLGYRQLRNLWLILTFFSR
jgi:cellulose synthase/poly-beta-1,6-N-acetylglucosamine synthase-like glycosyltransferase